VSRPRLTLRRGLLVAWLAAMTTWISLLAWKGFVSDSPDYLGPLLTFSFVMAALGAVARWARVPLAAVALLQLVLLGVWILLQYGGGGFASPEGIDSVVQAFRSAVDSAQTYQAPVPGNAPTVTPLLVAGGGVCLVLVDLLAAGLGRVPLAGLPLLLIYSLPVSIIGSGVAWVVFVFMAAGFLLLLFLREDERFSQWGRQVRADPRSADPHGFGVRTGSSRSNAAGIGATVTALALFVPAFIPELDVSLFSGGVGNGSGQGVSIINPITDLRRDLRQGADVPLLTATTSGGQPSYLKVAVLTNFNGEAWTTGDRDIPDSQVADGTPMPPFPGLSRTQVEFDPYTLNLSAVDDFESHWLPVPDLVTSADAPGEWKYDITTRDFIGGDDDLSTAGLTWTADGVRAKYSAQRLADATPAPANIEERYTLLPSTGIPSIARVQALAIASQNPTGYQKAVALQDYFRAPGAFEYTLDVDQANGSEALEQFLGDGPDGHRGYCEQFASAFAVMARLMHLPARVVVGFLNPDNVAEDTYVFSAHDLHAWPEVYFEGAGWVRFEPTPGNGAQAPAFTRQPVINLPSTDPTAQTSSPDDVPSKTPGASPSRSETSGAVAAGGGFPWEVLAGGAGGVLVLVALAFVPQLLRRRRRQARWSIGTAEAAWAELRDAVRDLRLPWPDGRSPHATGATLEPLLAAQDDSVRPPQGRAANPAAAAALDRLVNALELERYSGRPLVVDPVELEADVTACVASLAAGASSSARRQARWLPRSLRRPTSVREGLTRMRSARDSVVDHVS
jgi:transglutaminase-like putative cysteine protease